MEIVQSSWRMNVNCFIICTFGTVACIGCENYPNLWKLIRAGMSTVLSSLHLQPHSINNINCSIILTVGTALEWNVIWCIILTFGTTLEWGFQLVYHPYLWNHTRVGMSVGASSLPLEPHPSGDVSWYIIFTFGTTLELECHLVYHPYLWNHARVGMSIGVSSLPLEPHLSWNVMWCIILTFGTALEQKVNWCTIFTYGTALKLECHLVYHPYLWNHTLAVMSFGVSSLPL